MNYQPYFGMNILLSNEFVAFFQFVFFNISATAILLVLVAYQARRATNKRNGQC